MALPVQSVQDDAGVRQDLSHFGTIAFLAGVRRVPDPMSRSAAGENKELDDALRQARLREAAHFEAALDIRDAQTLRLQVLKDDLAPIAASRREAQDFFDLALIPGDPPRLWLDLITSVVMAPDPRTYRLVEDTQGGREILFETTDRTEMVERIRQHMAHRLIARARRMAARPGELIQRGYSAGALILSWLSGFTIGILVLFIAGVLISRFRD
jgi:hypothetical protein